MPLRHNPLQKRKRRTRGGEERSQIKGRREGERERERERERGSRRKNEQDR